MMTHDDGAQVMYEDVSMIRMKESLSLFKQWANHKNFTGCQAVHVPPHSA